MVAEWNLDELRALEGVVPIDRILQILRDPLARFALYTLEEYEHLSLDECADVTAAWANVTERTITSPDERDRVRAALYHVHLPKLDDAGVIDFDRTALETSLDDYPEELTSFLTGLREQDLGSDQSGEPP